MKERLARRIALAILGFIVAMPIVWAVLLGVL